MNDLKNKNIIVTGATGGIGNSIVKKLNDCEANILASGTKSEKLDELKSQFKNIKILKFDISQMDKIEEFIENAVSHFDGNLDCMFNLGKILVEGSEQPPFKTDKVKGTEYIRRASTKGYEKATQYLKEMDVLPVH